MADTITSLKKKMKHAGTLYVNSSDIITPLLKFMNDNRKEVEVIEHRVYDSFVTEIDYFNSKNWITYDDCRRFEFYIALKAENKMICLAEIWNGNNLTGCRNDRRFSVKLSIPDTFIKNLEDHIRYQFNAKLEHEYGEHLKKQRLDWIKARRAAVLKGGK